jgi:hypothetical protein
VGDPLGLGDAGGLPAALRRRVLPVPNLFVLAALGIVAGLAFRGARGGLAPRNRLILRLAAAYALLHQVVALGTIGNPGWGYALSLFSVLLLVPAAMRVEVSKPIVEVRVLPPKTENDAKST